jgi:hypothetical protein
MSVRSRSGALTAGLILIGLGLVFLLDIWNKEFSAWAFIAKYWPLILILIGARKLFLYFSWREGPAIGAGAPQGQAEQVNLSSEGRGPSLLGGLLWTGFGILFLLHNLGKVPDLWSMAGRYWPVLLILLGVGKVIDYYQQRGRVSLRVGEIIGILILIFVGLAVTRVTGSHFARSIRDIPWNINIGGTEVRPGQWFGNSYAYSEEKSYPIAPSTPVRVENAYGQVVVSPGAEEEVRIRLKKVIYQDDEKRAKEIAEQIRVEGGLDVSGAPVEQDKKFAGKIPSATPANIFVVKTNRDSLNSSDYRFNTDMEVSIPKNVELQIRNLYGEVRVTNLAGKLNISTTHNPIEIRDCIGDVTISNRYGETRLINLTGNVAVDSRGDVYVENIKGDVTVSDKYAPVVISGVDGKVSVSNTDQSINISKVSQPVVVDAPGAPVQVTDLRSTLRVTTSHRNVDISNVDSDVNLQSKYSTITLRDVKGNVDIDSNTDRINAESIGGHINLNGRGTGIVANDIKGSIEIRTTLKDVLVNGFSGGCNVTNEFADVSLSTMTLSKNGVAVTNHNGGIDLFLSQGTAFEIDAIAKNGRVNSEYPGLQSPQNSGENEILKAKSGSGGPKILLNTDNSSIHIRARESRNDRVSTEK